MTVTSQLEVTSGYDHVLVTDIDKGEGKIGNFKTDGFQNANSFGGADIFLMGRETDDWSYRGREIIRSYNGSESFKLSNNLASGVFHGSTNCGDLISQFIDEKDETYRDWLNEIQRIQDDPTEKGNFLLEIEYFFLFF